jgi:ribonucleoside-diphosphate reductase beta chain
MHNRTYQHIIETVVPPSDRGSIYGLWQNNTALQTRFKGSARPYQNAIDSPDRGTILRAIVANIIIESVFFPISFYFFYNLSVRGFLPGTIDSIRLIHRDESLHQSIFAEILKEYCTACDVGDDELAEAIAQTYREMTVDIDQWVEDVYGDRIGFSIESVIVSMNSLMSSRFPLGVASIPNPLGHLDRVRNESVNKANFFEAGVTNYIQASAVSWDF